MTAFCSSGTFRASWQSCNAALPFPTDGSVLRDADWGLVSFNPAEDKRQHAQTSAAEGSSHPLRLFSSVVFSANAAMSLKQNRHLHTQWGVVIISPASFLQGSISLHENISHLQVFDVVSRASFFFPSTSFLPCGQCLAVRTRVIVQQRTRTLALMHRLEASSAPWSRLNIEAPSVVNLLGPLPPFSPVHFFHQK